MPGGGVPPVQRTRVSNARLAVLFGVGVALIGLAPVAHLMLSPSSRVSAATPQLQLLCVAVAWHGTTPARLQQLQP
jgi:hypothetical protein